MGSCLCGGGCCACCVVCGAEVGALPCADDEFEAEKYEGWFFEGPFNDGDDNGASICACSKSYSWGGGGGLVRASLAVMKSDGGFETKKPLGSGDGDDNEFASGKEKRRRQTWCDDRYVSE